MCNEMTKINNNQPLNSLIVSPQPKRLLPLIVDVWREDELVSGLGEAKKMGGGCQEMQFGISGRQINTTISHCTCHATIRFACS